MKYGKDWVQVPDGQFKIDPNTKLPNGLTLAQAKQVIEKVRADAKAKGASDKEIQDWLEYVAKDMGTTLETLEALPDTPVNNSNTGSSNTGGSSKPDSNSNTSGGKTSGSSSSGSGSSGSSSSSSSSSSSGSNWREDYEKLPDWQKEMYGDPDAKGSDGTYYYSSKDEVPAAYRDSAYYVEGKGWTFDPFINN
jgi:cobalamin biosynthesis protein CobT